MHLLINQIGYESRSGKQAIASCTEAEALSASAVFFLVKDGVTVFESRPGGRTAVKGWKGRFFYLLDFSGVQDSGDYKIRLETEEGIVESSLFRIAEELLPDKCYSDILFYYKSQRSTWRWDKADNNVPFFGDRSDRVDVSGGWFDAAGDYSKYFSHLSYGNYMNPQQTPIVVWALLSLYDELSAAENFKGTLIEDRALEEGMHGADFLLRMQDPEGFFYITVFDQWSKDPERRMIAAFSGMKGELSAGYQAGYRQGAGMAIASLAKASRYQETGEFSSRQYLAAAVKGWEHLEENNTSYLDNGRENIIDIYCALTAAAELYKIIKDERFLISARKRAEQLISLYDTDAGYWLVEAASQRPYFHAAEAGLPISALMDYCEIEDDAELKNKAVSLVKAAVRDIIEISGDREGNIFMLAKQWTKPVNGDIRPSFFIPHENETGYWWQGENARLASLSYAVRRAKSLFGDKADDFLPVLDEFADAQLNWILGCNPYDMCMMQGHGRNNPRYEEHYPNAPGGICNGITAGYHDENDIDFLPAELEGRGDHRWRWSEQWIPHAAWFLLAVSAAAASRRNA